VNERIEESNSIDKFYSVQCVCLCLMENMPQNLTKPRTKRAQIKLLNMFKPYKKYVYNKMWTFCLIFECQMQIHFPIVFH